MRVPSHPTNIRRMLDSRVKQFAARKPLLADHGKKRRMSVPP